jgi:YVTN family beta-propeller protein
MTLERVRLLVAVLAIAVAELGCGDTFRPVAVPINSTPPNPASLHFMLTLSTNGDCNLLVLDEPCNRGASTRIDVPGDSEIGAAQVGLNPVHAVLLPDGDAVYVANQLEDTVSFYNPSGISPVSTLSLPPGSGPVFVETKQNSAVYVANAGNNTVSVITTANNAVENTIPAVENTIPVGPTPVALAEMPNGEKLYVANLGTGASPVNGSVMSVNTVDDTVNPVIAPPAGAAWNAPTWIVARTDNARVYALDQGTGLVAAIDTSSDTVVGVATVGAGANFMLYSAAGNRLYITNPVAATLTILDATTAPSSPTDPLTVLASISFAASNAANAPCPTGCVPVSVAALPDGSRAYVATYQITPSTCSNPTQAPPCIVARATVVNLANNSVSKTISVGVLNPSAPITVPPTFQPDTPVAMVGTTAGLVAECSLVRFRLFAAAAGDSTRVYLSYCDAGATAVISTVPDTSPGSQSNEDYLVNELSAPVSALPPPPSPAPQQPPPQSPVFVLAGP